MMLTKASNFSTLYGAHRLAATKLPILTLADLEAVQSVLVKVRAGGDAAPAEDGVFPTSVEINSKMTILMDVSLGRQWD
jgi:hypothetical protein